MGLFGKLFHHPAVPDGLRAQLEAEGLIYLAEKVGVTLKFSGSVPGLFSGASRNRGNGALAITRQRLYATFPSAPRLAGSAIDQQWDAQSGPAVVTLDESGVQLDIEIGRLDPRFHGQLTLLYRQPLTADVLGQLPARSLRFTVPPEYVFHILGVRAKTEPRLRAMSIDRAALAVGSIRLASGIQFLIDPVRANRVWGGSEEPKGTHRLLLYSMGYRDALIGGLLASAALRGKNTRGWFLASGGADAADLMGGLSAHNELKRSEQIIGLGGAIVGIGVGLWGRDAAKHIKEAAAFGPEQ